MSSGWKSKFLAVWPYATTVTSVMFTVCAMLGAFLAWRAGAQGTLGYIIAIVDPSIAAIAMLVVCFVTPDVFVGPRFRFPHIVTMPTVYLVLVFGIKSVAMSAAPPIRRFDGADRYDMVWLRPPVLVLAWVLIVLVLSTVSAFSKDSEDVK